MTDEMLTAQAQWLPQYQSAIEAADQRLAKAKENGTYLPVREGFAGTNRLKLRTVEEMAADRDQSSETAGKTDKAH